MGKLIEKLKILIVDDEHLIRNLLRMRIDWAAQGMEIVGEAANAGEAMALVEQLQPDIIFTDIYMPKVDGIEFSEQVLASYPQIKIVIVTGHDEFEYARRSIKIGVFDFILKPIRPVELLQITSKLREKIQQERLHHHKIEQLQEVMERNRNFLKEQFLTQWLRGTLTEQEIVDKAIHFGLPLCGEMTSVQIALIEPVSMLLIPQEKEQQEKQLSKLIAACKHEVERFYDVGEASDWESCQFMIMTDPSDRLVLIACHKEINLAKDCEQIGRLLSTSHQHVINIGVGSQYSKSTDAYLSYQEAARALHYHAFIGENDVICFEDIADKMDTSYQSDSKMLDQLQFHISIGASEQAVEQLNAIFDISFSSITQFRMAAIDVIMECQRAAIEQQLDSEVAFDKQILASILTANQLAELLTALQSYVTDVANAIYAKLQPPEDNLIYQVKAYLEQHLSDPDVSLASTAAHFYISSGHLGRLMKKETGQTFVEYLTQIRMKKAELLLKQTDLRGYEIGEQVGIPDPHYFSVLFKKNIGRSMNEYRSVRNFK